MPRLTHLVVMDTDRVHLSGVSLSIVVGMATLINYIPPSCRVILGLFTHPTFDIDGFLGAVSPPSECLNLQVTLLTYRANGDGSRWFTERIVDGTLWDMDLEEYRDPENKIECLCLCKPLAR
jgi:hypothetical protein